MVRLYFTPEGKPFVKIVPNLPHRLARRVITPYGPGAVVGTWIAPNGEVLTRVALEYEPSEKGTRRKLSLKERVIMAFPKSNVADVPDDNDDMFVDMLSSATSKRTAFGEALQRLPEYA